MSPFPKLIPRSRLRRRARERFFRTRPYARMLLIVAIIVLLVGGFFAYRYFSSYESTDDAQIDGHLMPLSARIHRLHHQGQRGRQPVRPARRRSSPRWTRAITRWPSTKPRPISLTPKPPLAPEHQCPDHFRQHHEPGVRHRRPTSKTPRRESTPRSSSTTPPQAQLAQAEANNVKAQNDLVRYKQLVDKQEISRAALRPGRCQAASARAAVSAAKSSASAAEQQIHQARAKLLQAQANLRSSQTGPQQVAQTRARAQSAVATVQQKQAALDQAELNL